MSPELSAQQRIEGCRSKQLEKPITQSQSNSISLSSGILTIELDCHLSVPSVLSFSLNNMRSIHIEPKLSGSLERLRSNHFSVIVPSGESLLTAQLEPIQATDTRLYLESMSTFSDRTVVHLSTLSLFIGLCLALTIYVGMLGKGMRNRSFFAYSVYLLNVVIFFSLQEGVLNYGFWSSYWHHYSALQYAFAGMIVSSAILFLSQLLELRLILSRWLYIAVWTCALGILLTGFGLAAIPALSHTFLGQVMGWSTLLLVFSVFAITGYASLQKIHTANILFVALSFIFIAMVFRVWLTEFSPFLHRYALIISTAVEALIFAFAVSEKVRALESEKSRAYHAASQDSLCTVLNRRGWRVAVNRKMQQLQKHEGVVILLYIDIDEFKQVNDNYGHSFGDRALQTVAKIIRHQSREGDLVGRLGGDEFVVFSHSKNEAQAYSFLARFRTKLSQLELWLNNKPIVVSASVGAIIKPCNDADLAKMLDLADRSMYQQKQHSSTTF